MIANIEIECEKPEIVLESLKPDIDKTDKFDVDIKTGEGKIILIVESNDISGLLAGINSYLKLIRTSIEVDNIG